MLFFSCQNPKPIELDYNIIDPMWRGEQLYTINQDLNYYTVDEFEFDLNGDNKNDKIQLKSIKGWENDPGDFHKIEIELSNGATWSEINGDGWVRFNQNYQVPDDIIKKNESGTDLFLITKFGGQYIIGLFGYVYASEPGYLLLIEFSSGEPRVFLGTKMDLNEITKNKIVGQSIETNCVLTLNGTKLTSICK